MTFAVLGALEVHRGDEPVEISGRRLRALLVLLLLDAGRTVPASRLITGIWDDRPPGAAGNALQALVSRLRAALAAERGVVEATASGYRLAVERDRVDAHRFARLAAEGRAALSAGAPAEAADVLRAALGLWRGPALADLVDPADDDATGFAGSAAAAAARLEALRLAVVEDRVEADLLLGRRAEAVAELPGLITAHPLRERFHGQLMRALYGSGRRVEALAAYEAAREAFARELGADPSPGLAGLHLAMLRGEWAEKHAEPRPARISPPAGAGSPPAGTRGREIPPSQGEPVVGEPRSTGAASAADPAPAGDARRGNLRARLTSFVGRERDVARTAGFLARHRLVTLTGPGGAGKTRLAIETAEAMVTGTTAGTAEEAAGRAPDGAWLVELAPVAEPSEVPQAVLSALAELELRDAPVSAGIAAPVPASAPAGIAAPARRDPVTRLVAALTGRRLLIVLDNCEHVVEAAAALAERLLASCPGVRILATGREPLGIAGELAWPVPSLGLPPDGADPREALAYPAVRLFAERAETARPGYRPERETAAIVRICRELDGMPLAIELAAARLRVLSAAQIAQRLDDRFRLLTGGSRTALPRHRTLRAVVEWSWDLLDGPERVLARRLAVFAGGAALGCVERVCAGDGLDRDDVLGVLARLVDKSLVVADEHGAAVRYRMLETVRAYAAERLAESGEEPRVRLAHAVFFTELAEASDPALRDRGQAAALAALAAEHDNLSAALRWAVEESRTVLALRLAGALGWYWWLRGHRAEGARRAREAVGLATGGEDPRLIALAEAAHGYNALSAGVTLDAARASLGEVVRLAREELPRPWHPSVAMADAVAALFGGGPLGEPDFGEMLAHPDPWVVCSAHLMRGVEHLSAGRVAEAGTDLGTALDGFERIGDRWGAGNALAGLAEIDLLHGESARALERMRESIRRMEEIGAIDEVTFMRGRLAIGLHLRGERAAAEETLEKSLLRALESGDRMTAVPLLVARGDFARRDGDLERARRHYAEAAGLLDRETGTPPQLHAVLGTALGLLAEQEGDPPRARRLLGAALTKAVESRDTTLLVPVLVGLAGVALAGGDPGGAAVLLGGAAAARGTDAVVDFDHVRVTERAVAVLGREGFSRRHEHGRALPREEIIDLATRAPGRAS
ncbi:BTAD domain-containing putative transcriptional regulator [Streptosporangium sp. NPDC004379]|uniref:AfsR/SARP family transcriptional regulator n=1 Tax=Streptosporangium sp. NPDC004379 TaxID=3366189 RepID=UPI0036BAFC14